MRIRISERLDLRGPWNRLLDLRSGPDGIVADDVPPLSEGCDLSLTLWPDADETPHDIEIRIGDVLVASTRAHDRPEYRISAVYSDDGPIRYVCVGKLLSDWVGQTELTIDVGDGRVRRRVLTVKPLNVSAGKLAREVYEALCAEIAAQSADLLLDVYGKTYVGLQVEQRAGEVGPLAALRQIRQTLDHLTTALREIARRPAARLRSHLVREPALVEQSVTDLTLEEVCLDPTIAVRHDSGVRFREQVREVATPNYDLPENRVLAGFLHFLRLQLADLRARAVRETTIREANKAYRHRRDSTVDRSWWEQEDLPRLTELSNVLQRIATLDGEIPRILRHYPFLPPGGPLREVPRSTPLFRLHRAYAAAFQVVVAHFRAYRVELDETHLVARARSLPVLYEWWCVLEVLRILKGVLRLSDDAAAEDSPFRRLGAERDRFVIEFGTDQAMDFRDATGRLVRFRYVPRYRSRFLSLAQGYGLLGAEAEMTPDLALEIFPLDPTRSIPELIVVLDAKYSTVAHPLILDRVRSKYGKIGAFATGTVLSRQVWALVPTQPHHVAVANPGWAASCTADNLSFYSEGFDVTSSVAGVVQARPLMPGRPPVESLLRLILTRAGLALTESSPLAPASGERGRG